MMSSRRNSIVALTALWLLTCTIFLSTSLAGTKTFDEECLSLIDKGYYRWAKKYAESQGDVSAEVALEAKLRCALYNRNRRDLRRLLAHAPKCPIGFLTHAVLAHAGNQLRKAESNCQLGLAMNVARPRVKRELQLLLGQVYLEGYAYIAAAEVLFGDGNRDFNPYLILAKELGVRDDDHYRLAKAATFIDPSSVTAWKEVMRGAIRLRELKVAQEAFEKIALLEQERLNPQASPRGPIEVASYRQPKRLAKWPDDEVLLLELANLAWKNDENYEANWLSTRASNFSEVLPPMAYDLLGLLAYRMKQYERALRFFSRQGRDTAFPGPYGHLRFLFGTESERREAIEYLEGATGEEAKLALAKCCIEKRNYGRAKELLKEIGLHYGSRYDYWTSLAKVHLALKEERESEQALRQIIVLAKIGIIGRNQSLLAADTCYTLGFSHIGKELRLVDYDPKIYDRSKSRPYRLSGFAYRILADRAALEKESEEALSLLNMAGLQLAHAGLAAWSIRQQPLTEPLVERLMDRVPNVRIQLPTVGGRVLLEAGRPDDALDQINRGLNVDVDGTPGLFLLAATAQAARQDLSKMGMYTNTAAILGARRGAPWQELARLMAIVGNEGAKNIVASFLRNSPHRRDRPDDRTAVLAMGNLALEALTTHTINDAPGALYGHGLAYGTLGRDDLAIESLERCSAIDSVWQSEAKSELFSLALRNGREELARKLLAQLEKGRYSHIELLRAKYDLSHGRTKEVRQALEGAIKKAPYRAEPRLLMAQVDEFNGLRHLERASELGPHMPIVWKELMAYHMSRGESSKGRLYAINWLRATLLQGNFTKSQDIVMKLLDMRKERESAVARGPECRAFFPPHSLS